MELSQQLSRSYTPFAFYLREFQRKYLTVGLSLGIAIFLTMFISYKLTPYVTGEEKIGPRKIDITIDTSVPPPPPAEEAKTDETSGGGGEGGGGGGGGGGEGAAAGLEQELAAAAGGSLFAEGGGIPTASTDASAGTGEGVLGSLAAGGGLRGGVGAGAGLSASGGLGGGLGFGGSGTGIGSGSGIGIGSGNAGGGVGTKVAGLTARIKRGAGDYGDDGGRSGSEIDKVLSKYERAINDCYESAKRNNPGLKGSVEISFVILQAGNVGGARVTSSSLKNPAVEQCLINKFRTFRFSPSSDGKPQQITVPYDFTD